VQTRYNGEYSFWQYSGSGRAEGIGVEVDMDVRYISSPGRVAGLKAEEAGGRTGEAGGRAVRLTWDRVAGAYGYIVYRYEPEAGGYAEYARTVGAASAEYVDEEPLDNCRYAVCAYVRQSGVDYRGGLSDPASPDMK
jgi:hypothetical protein